MGRFLSVLMNPVLGKEVKLRFRSFKSFLGIMIYLLVLGSIAIGFIYLESMANTANGGFRSEDSQALFLILTIVQMMLICFMAPGLTAGVISGEREKQTLNILLTTRQSSAGIILSKLFSSLAFLLLIVLSSLPIYAIVFVYGGVSPQTVLATFGVYLLSMFTFGSLGILFSTLVRKTIVSMITTYGVVLLLTAGTAILLFFSISFIESAQNSGQVHSSHPFSYMMMALNPVVILVAALEPTMVQEIRHEIGIDTPLWIGFLCSYLIIAIVAVWISIIRLRPRMKKKIATGREVDE